MNQKNNKTYINTNVNVVVENVTQIKVILKVLVIVKI